jgi:metallophosphoesterase superfamily enzyme
MPPQSGVEAAVVENTEEENLEILVEKLKELNPKIVISYGDSGNGGHKEEDEEQQEKEEEAEVRINGSMTDIAIQCHYVDQ